jgi:hypothetical protein
MVSRDFRVFRDLERMVFRDSKVMRERKDSKDCKVRFHKVRRDQKVSKVCLAVFRDSKVFRAMLERVFRASRAMPG